MAGDSIELLSGTLVDNCEVITLAELCHCCVLPAEQIMLMVEHGIIEPLESRHTTTRWQFGGQSVLRVQTALRLQQDLGVNMAGVALALDLLDEIKALRQLTAALQRSGQQPLDH